MIKLAAFHASGDARMKLRLAGTARTSNISFFFDLTGRFFGRRRG
jgi:hypothetical protein